MKAHTIALQHFKARVVQQVDLVVTEAAKLDGAMVFEVVVRFWLL